MWQGLWPTPGRSGRERWIPFLYSDFLSSPDYYSVSLLGPPEYLQPLADLADVVYWGIRLGLAEEYA